MLQRLSPQTVLKPECKMVELNGELKQSIVVANNQAQSTTEWYVNWLTETRPDLTPEQVLEMATGFANQQLPLVRKPDIDDAEEDSSVPTAEEVREAQRSRARLTGKELAAIIGQKPWRT